MQGNNGLNQKWLPMQGYDGPITNRQLRTPDNKHKIIMAFSYAFQASSLPSSLIGRFYAFYDAGLPPSYGIRLPAFFDNKMRDDAFYVEFDKTANAAKWRLLQPTPRGDTAIYLVDRKNFEMFEIQAD